MSELVEKCNVQRKCMWENQRKDRLGPYTSRLQLSEFSPWMSRGLTFGTDHKNSFKFRVQNSKKFRFWLALRVSENVGYEDRRLPNSVCISYGAVNATVSITHHL